MKEPISISEVKVLIHDIKEKLNESNHRMMSELENNIRIEKSLELMYNAFPVFKKQKREVVIYIDKSKCTMCGECVDICNYNVLTSMKLPFHKEIAVINPDNCIGCLHCMSVCKPNAIEVTRYK
jgi:ferredoxin